MTNPAQKQQAARVNALMRAYRFGANADDLGTCDRKYGADDVMWSVSLDGAGCRRSGEQMYRKELVAALNAGLPEKAAQEKAYELTVRVYG